MNLVEGNVLEQVGFQSDEHTYNTLFRNRITNGGINGNNLSNYFIGNEFTEIKNPFSSQARWGNNPSGAGEGIDHGNYVTEPYSGLTWDSDIENQDLPDSYYLTERPSWFGDLDWPPYGGDLMPDNMKRNPAEVRYWTIHYPEKSHSGLKAEVTGNEYTLSWTNNSTNEVDFIVCRSTDNLNFHRIGYTYKASFTDTVAEAGSYYYYVRARNHLGGRNYHGELFGIDPGGESDPSNVITTINSNVSIGQSRFVDKLLSVFPNPAQDVLHFNHPDNQAETILIYTDSGKLVMDKMYMDNSIDISELSKGMYFLVIKGIREHYTAKFIAL